MRILFIGDIVGKPGRSMVEKHLPRLQQEFSVDFTIANGENCAGGSGMNRASFEQLHSMGVDAFTMGNHTWGNKDLLKFIDSEKRIVRPGNLSAKPLPGTYYQYYQVNGAQLLLVNMIGRTYMPPAECPFAAMDALLEQEQGRTPFIFLDFHAEATSDKVAMGWYMDGRVSAVVGTHTHVQTNDARILPRGTGYLTDAGMTGPRDSVLGVEKEVIIDKFLYSMPRHFDPAAGDLQFNGALFDLDDSGRCCGVQLVNFWEPGI